MILTGKAKLAGAVGWPISHSLSPRLHGFWIEKHQIDAAYLPLSVAPENLTEVVGSLAKMGFAGVNLTVPHKEAAMKLVDQVEDIARRVGAVNTIVVNDDHSLTGSNTDGFGFITHLQATVPSWSGAAGPAVVLGAGGAARGICAALLGAGVPELRLINRTRQRAEQLATDIGGAFAVYDWGARANALIDAALLVNTTTLGMAGGKALDIELTNLPVAAPVYDIVYVPLRTPLLAQAIERGHPAIDGLGMLLHQARPGFASWFGIDPDVTDELRAFVWGS